jgi:hypothetical protein
MEELSDQTRQHSFKNYAVEGSISLMWNEQEIYVDKFKTRYQRWAIQEKYISLIEPLLIEKKFYFKISHEEPVNVDIVRPIRTGFKLNDGR